MAAQLSLRSMGLPERTSSAVSRFERLQIRRVYAFGISDHSLLPEVEEVQRHFYHVGERGRTEKGPNLIRLPHAGADSTRVIHGRSTLPCRLRAPYHRVGRNQLDNAAPSTLPYRAFGRAAAPASPHIIAPIGDTLQGGSGMIGAGTGAPEPS